MSGATLSRRAVGGDDAFLRYAKPLGLNTCWCGDHLNTCGCQCGSWSSWFGKVLSVLVAKAFIEGVAAPKGPHAATVRLEPRALGLRPLDQSSRVGRY
jgi:hypothetical protein